MTVKGEPRGVKQQGGLLDDAQFERLLREAKRALAPFVQRDGSVAFEMPALVIAARKD